MWGQLWGGELSLCPHLAGELGAGSEPGLLVPPPELLQEQLLLPTGTGRVGITVTHEWQLRTALSGRDINPSSPTHSHQFKLMSRKVYEPVMMSLRAEEGSEPQVFCADVCAESISIPGTPRQHLPP